ncbi:MAG: SIR2 family NAD-dependent protein deacylase, partial [Alphaproteobacteria bacterium]
GVSRARGKGDAWFHFHDVSGAEVPASQADTWATVVYKPHGGIWPVGNFLVSDSDYVEALTEIDIQSPIPGIVQQRRADCGFVFLGCRFYDQMLRTYARQILKRSAGPHYAMLPEEPTANERRFLEEQGITVV